MKLLKRGKSEEATTAQLEQRILVLGSAPHSRFVTTYCWDSLPEDLNVADYDLVILNLVPLLKRGFAKSINLKTLPSSRSFSRLLFSEGSEIVAIGTPGLKIGDNPYRDNTWWLPITPKSVWDGGEAIRNVDPAFEFYFRHVRNWFFHFTLQYENPDTQEAYLKAARPDLNGLEAEVVPIAETRFQRPVALKLSFVAHGAEAYRGKKALDIPTEPKRSGEVIWLPPATEISPYEAVNLILQQRYGLALEHSPPEWVLGYKLPQQLPIEEEIERPEEEIKRLDEELKEQRNLLAEAKRFQGLLYEQGEDVLEPVVRQAFRELGAEVYDPEQPGGDDGRMTDPLGHKYTLEIKGRTGALKLDDVRQLRQWVDDAEAYRDWRSKGLLVANLWCSDPPNQRERLVPRRQARTAKGWNQCVLTTAQLFRALGDHQRGELDFTGFWNSVFETNGVSSLPGSEPLEDPIERNINDE
ncbi:MAG: hypothetical protein PVH50_08930 [Anaerolineae bacterium]|jgi:hypothetical protein